MRTLVLVGLFLVVAGCGQPVDTSADAPGEMLQIMQRKERRELRAETRRDWLRQRQSVEVQLRDTRQARKLIFAGELDRTADGKRALAELAATEQQIKVLLEQIDKELQKLKFEDDHDRP